MTLSSRFWFSTDSQTQHLHDISITDLPSTTEPLGPGTTVKRSNERERGRCHNYVEQENWDVRWSSKSTAKGIPTLLGILLLLLSGLKTKDHIVALSSGRLPPAHWILRCFYAVSALHLAGTQCILMTTTTMTNNKKDGDVQAKEVRLLASPFDSIDAAWKISKLVFCSHVFIRVSKQLLNKLLSKKRNQADRLRTFLECNCVTPMNLSAVNYKSAGQQGFHVLSPSEIGAGSMVSEHFRDVYHFSTIRTCSTVELLILSTLLLSISYLIVISSGLFVWCSLVFSFFALAAQRALFLAELECPVKPLLPLSCFRKSPQSQMTRGGKETFTVMWEIPSQEKEIKEGRHMGPFCLESGTGRPAITWAGPVHDWSNITLTGNPGSQVAMSSWPAVSWAERLAPDTELCSPCCKMPLYRNGGKNYTVPSVSSEMKGFHGTMK